MKKVGIMGGTFNPIHNGHLALAKEALVQFALDEVWLMPSKLPPHKSHFAMLSEAQRFELTKLASETDSRFVASDFELQREGLTYTADTLELLNQEYPDTSFYFIIGGDSLLSFSHWRKPDRILALCTLLAAGRSGIEGSAAGDAILSLRKAYPYAKIEALQLGDYPISSSRIREAFYAGNSSEVKDFMPSSVYTYLTENKLYQAVSYSELDEEMQLVLPRKRYLHSVSVAHLCAAYAAVNGLDCSVALTAGILHDCAKAYPDEVLLQECKKYGLPVSDTEQNNGYLLHGKVGAYYAKKHYYIRDERILNAITYHTTGREAMSEYEKIVFLADYLEPFRTQPTSPELNKIREIAFRDIDYAVYLVLENTMRYLTGQGKEIDEMTPRAYHYYKTLVEKRTK